MTQIQIIVIIIIMWSENFYLLQNLKKYNIKYTDMYVYEYVCACIYI